MLIQSCQTVCEEADLRVLTFILSVLEIWILESMQWEDCPNGLGEPGLMHSFLIF